MGDELLRIDLRLPGQPWAASPDQAVVVVEPLYGCVAVAAAIDAGWDSVQLAREADATGPIPLVSFEQPPPRELELPRCRVRCTALVETMADAGSGGGTAPTLLLGCVANARPLASLLAAAGGALSDITVVPAGVRDREGVLQPLAADSLWASGLLLRILLEELEERPVALDDGAGVCVTLARGAEDPAAQLSSGARWRRHLEAGGHADDLRVAAALDSIGAVPAVEVRGGAFEARQWQPGYSGS